MFSYQQQLTDSRTRLITPEEFWAYCKSPETARLVSEARQALQSGDEKTYNEKKKQLALMIFVGTFEDREIMELKAFHNEEDGQMYANQESISGMFNVYWNFIYTGTPYALHRKVNQRNFGTGMSSRLAVIPLPYRGKVKHVMETFSCSQPTASRTINRLKADGIIEDIGDHTYRKVLSELP